MENKRDNQDKKQEGMIMHFDSYLVLPISSCTSQEIQHKRIENPDLIEKSFVTADYAVYTMEEGEVVLYLAPYKQNAFYKYKAFGSEEDPGYKLRYNGEYVLLEEDLEEIVSSNASSRFIVSEVDNQESDPENIFYDAWHLKVPLYTTEELKERKIEAKGYDGMNLTQRRLFEKVHGTGESLIENINMMREHKIESVDISIIKPKVIEQMLKQRNAKGLGYLCALGGTKQQYALEGIAKFGFHIERYTRESVFQTHKMNSLVGEKLFYSSNP